MRTLGIIPARAGSKRLPRKNVLPLGGKPMVCWVIEAARKAQSLDRLVVSSDDPEVLALAAGYDPGIVLERPAELATDTSPAIEYVKHALVSLERRGEEPFSVVVILQPSSPLTQPDDINATVQLLLRTGADTAVSVVRLDHAIHPVKLKIMEGDRLLPYLEEERGRLAAHELPVLYVRNCAVYATRRYVIESGQIIGADCRGYVMPRERSIDINDELDYRFAEFLVERCGVAGERLGRC
ncbi:MAG: acylneuraminate cytidylyltransferase family protein [Verrucomicrobia bacterium]|nr:acylneuraminate cytidylyltransferase family protein [Verrucomicrobiota bacterium]